ncbi:DEAD/DEAH box helicase [Thermincola potens]|uniref:DEAD/DEAH box helicase domain protein n=1 Tax=Thermincola potens (strain JR) TaxID=635013 RepID=D5XE59_THEPJ|nr:DEAD/DEAH box helicase [Thermincola potens]ADG81930.1 DEAD/DEAH box helicase domain protein [Thermincola potens JR]
MDVKKLLLGLNGNILFEHDEPEKPAKYSKLPEGLATSLNLITKFEFPKGLYAHQAKCIDSILQGKHTAICTSTASGKSLCFSYPVISEMLKNKKATALFIYPVKALANDQIRRIEQLAKKVNLNPSIIKKFDGDIHGEERKDALARGRILVATPDVLHTTMLRENNKEEYARFFANLRYVILDECHVYSGAFGSNMAYVVRRLRQVCKRNGSDPLFILASATVGNPHRHLSKLTGLENITVIGEKDNGSPFYGKKYIMTETDGNVETFVLKLIKGLVNGEGKFLVFCHTRQEVEHLFLQLKRRDMEIEHYIKPYRAGYESGDRLGIENALRSGELKGVISTSALELGVDLPDLDICVMLGLPSTKCSLLQQAGRVGRAAQGTVVIIKTRNAFDNYYFNHPRELFEKPLEPLVLHLENRPLMIAHYACARAESGNFDNPGLDMDIFGEPFIRLAHKIRDFDFPDEILYVQQPHFDVQIRCIDDPSYNIIIGYDPQAPPIGKITYSQILREAYPDAVYLHMGKPFRVKGLSHSKKAVFVDARCSFSLTKPKAEIFVKERHCSSGGMVKKWHDLLEIRQTSLSTIEKVTGLTEFHGKNKSEHRYKQPLMRHFVTEGVIISLRGLNHISHSAVVGLATALEHSYPMCYPCAREDIASYAWTRGNEEGHIYLFDNSAGGLALTWAALDNFARLLELTYNTVANCSNCNNNPEQNGCINCVDANRWYTYNVHSDRSAVLGLLGEIQRITESVEPRVFVTGSVQKIREKYATDEKKQYGRTMISSGSLVFTGRHQEGFVVSSQPFKSSVDDRLYDISVDGTIFKFIGSSLTLLKGTVEKWCLNCGEEAIEYSEENCPVCGVKL